MITSLAKSDESNKSIYVQYPQSVKTLKLFPAQVLRKRHMHTAREFIQRPEVTFNTKIKEVIFLHPFLPFSSIILGKLYY